MPEWDQAIRARAAARMLLAAPDAALLSVLAQAASLPLDHEQARQDFYDFLCVPQSGCYIPPYAHVLGRGEWNGEYWHFPPPHFDGGDRLGPWYEAAGFDPARLDADPLIAGPNRPLDHAGFILAFLAGMLEQADREPTGSAVVQDFVAEHLGSWVDLLAELLAVSGSPYIRVLGEELGELIRDVRTRFVVAEELPQGAT